MKKYITIICLLTACSSYKPKETNTPCTSKGCLSKTFSRKSKSNDYKIYAAEIDAFICEGSAKGYIMYCDIENDYITGFVKSNKDWITYYEKGKEINGLIFEGDGKTIKTYFNNNYSSGDFIVINYYRDGSISSYEIENKNNNTKQDFYKKGEKYNTMKDKVDINKLVYNFQN